MSDDGWSYSERYLLRSLQIELERKWKEREDRKGISKDARLKIELNKLPSHWVQAIYKELGYVERVSKKEQIEYITRILCNKRFLEKILVELSRSSLFILKFLLEKGGWSTFQHLSRQAITDESSDGWWWEEEPPSSPLGKLRVRGLVFVGRTPIKKRFYKIGVIPRELRGLLREVLPRVYQMKDLQEKKKTEKRFLNYGDEVNYQELIQEIKDYFNQIDWFTFLKEDQVIDFLDFLKNRNSPYQEIEKKWSDIQCFHYFVDSFSFDKKSLDEFKVWEFSYFVSRFIPQKFGEYNLVYEDIKRILETVAQLYRFLKDRGEIKSDTEIRKAVSRIIQPDGKIARIPIPRAKGPEALLITTLPGKKELVFTNNDLWISIVLYLQYDKSWGRMILDLEKKKKSNLIVDAERKKEYVFKLKEKLEKNNLSPSHLLSSIKPDRREIDKAFNWFYNKKIIIK